MEVVLLLFMGSSTKPLGLVFVANATDLRRNIYCKYLKIYKLAAGDGKLCRSLVGGYWWSFARRLENQQSKSGDPRGLILDKSHSFDSQVDGEEETQTEKVDLMAPQRHDGDQDEGA